MNLKNMTIATPPFEELQQKIDLLYILEIPENRFETSILPNLPNIIHNDTVIILEQIHQSHNRQQLWKTLQNHKSVTVSVDTFSFGFLFFRKEQPKQHFTIRL